MHQVNAKNADAASLSPALQVDNVGAAQLNALNAGNFDVALARECSIDMPSLGKL